MCKSILADQFLGATFANMVSRNIYEIEITKLSKLEKVIDKSLRDTHNAMLLFSTNDILTTVDEYSDFFSINYNAIALSDVIVSEIVADMEKKDHLISVFQQYFTSGIPNSINNTLTAILDKTL